MRIDNKILLFFLGFIVAGVLVTVYFPKEEVHNIEATLRIGAGDDMSGVLMEEVLAQLDSKYIVQDDVESSSFQDC